MVMLSNIAYQMIHRRHSIGLRQSTRCCWSNIHTYIRTTVETTIYQLYLSSCWSPRLSRKTMEIFEVALVFYSLDVVHNAKPTHHGTEGIQVAPTTEYNSSTTS